MNWSKVKALLNYKVLSISYIILAGVPLLIDFNKKIEEYFGKNTLPETLICFFFASVFLGAALVLYKMRCDEVIQNYKDVGEYVNKELPGLLISHPDKKKQIVITHLSESQKESLDKIADLDRRIRAETRPNLKSQLERELQQILDELYPGCVQRHLKKKWESFLTLNTISLVACNVFIAFAIVLIGYVFYFRIEKVILYTQDHYATHP
ncbi:MAG: hypothetical protein JNJ75_04445 [Cyclobacteriaceae bacterium]|nr:hypothetical protein [Cyclobacteriaceae bacterium]